VEKSKLDVELKDEFDEIWAYYINKVYNAKFNTVFYY
jgi:hypothetical protein